MKDLNKLYDKALEDSIKNKLESMKSDLPIDSWLKVNSIDVEGKYVAYRKASNYKRHKLNYEDKLKEVGKRIKIQNRLDRCLKMDVAHGTLETIYAVFSNIKRLLLNYINLNDKGGCNNAK